MAKGRTCCKACLGVLFPCCLLTGLVCIGAGIAVYLEYPSILNDQVNQKVTVQAGHATYEQLKEPSIPIYKAFYFFNLTNAEEFADAEGGIKPILKEMGPYSYREHRKKTFLDGTRSPDTIGYKQTKMFFFDKNTSMANASETDMICTINIPLVAALNMTKDSTILKTGLDTIVNIVCKAKLFICKPARELAWNYTDCLVQKLEDLHQYPLKYVNIQVNNSADDSKESIIHTGRTDITKIGQFVQWDGLRNLKIWRNGNGANDINGTEGFFFGPHLKEGDNLTVFVDDIKRSIDLVYTGKVSQLGIPAFSYGIDNRTFKSAFSESENSRWGSWCPDGLFYLGPTQPKEIPVYGSKPHFLDGDPRLLDSVVGLKPDREKHDTITDIEPITGVNLNFRRQVQINVQINRTTSYFPGLNQIHKIKGFNGTDTLYFPVLYINEYAAMDEQFKDYLEDNGLREIHMAEILFPALFGVALAIGAVCLLISVISCAGFISLSKKEGNDENQPLLSPSRS